jgi:diketogulonate reductase-like aldo/keto reductase
LRVSNYSAELIDGLIDATGEVPVVNQIEWSPFGHSEEMMRYAKAKRIIIQAYSPRHSDGRSGTSRDTVMPRSANEQLPDP